MSVLPRQIPAHARRALDAALEGTGVRITGPAPNTRVTLLAEHEGQTWRVAWLGIYDTWGLIGPTGSGCEHTVGRPTDEVAEAITAPWPKAEPEPVDPHPGVPRTHLGVDVPEFVRADWGSERAQWFRLGVAAAVGKLPDTRPRA
ncbi:hypothetical protein ACF08W_29300 [Streptomyces sp. NPDC015144]|uniref:hypothetical protein n=1 Tax=Streptomyces sp. NPDC015144 TaxID=3364944 RepID=UPI0037022756